MRTSPKVSLWGKVSQPLGRRVLSGAAAVALVASLGLSGAAPVLADEDTDTTVEEIASPDLADTDLADLDLVDSDLVNAEPELDSEKADNEITLPTTNPLELLDAVLSEEPIAPYIHWDVRDTEGNLVPGATFKLEYRDGDEWVSGTGADQIEDCDEICAQLKDQDQLDIDATAGEILLENRDTGLNSRLEEGENYRVSQVDAPEGYSWVIEGENTQTIGDDDEDSANWNDIDIHDFGTFEVQQGMPTAFRAALAGGSLTCEPGYVYGISANGQLQQVTSGGVVNIGSRASGVSSFNGLGIGNSGQTVYAYERQNNARTAKMYSFDPATEEWEETGDSYNTENSPGNYSGSLVAGAINLGNGKYYFGGFETTSRRLGGRTIYRQVFKVWEYDPERSGNKFTYKGEMLTYDGSRDPGATNGDMAFNAAGDLFVVRGNGTTTTVFSVTAANFEAANGGSITTAGSNDFTTMSNVNGVAFDASGRAYLGSGSEIRSYAMPGWNNQQNVVSRGYSGTDLASCSSPATITIEKEIIGGRVNTDDQFTLTLKQGSEELARATTTGSDLEIQEDRIGPLPTERGVMLDFAETGANGTNLANYASAYQCTVTYIGGATLELDQEHGTAGSVVIPTGGDSVKCVIRNSPLIATVNVNKQVTDAQGENPEPRAGWEVSATTESPVVMTPNVGVQETGADGTASWEMKFSSFDQTSSVLVSEVMQDGYQFQSGKCEVTSLTGVKRHLDLTGPESTEVSDVEPGDTVDCTYVNKPAAGEFKIIKEFDGTVLTGMGKNTEFKGAYVCKLDDEVIREGVWTSTGVGEAVLDPSGEDLPSGTECSVTEALPEATDGLPNSSWNWGVPKVSDPVVIESDETGAVTVTNAVKRVYGKFDVTKVLEGIADADLNYSGEFSCRLDDETVTGTWGGIASGEIWNADATHKIPLGAECSVLSEDRPQQPVSNDPSYSWDGDPEFTDAVVSVPLDSSEANLITVTNRTKQQLGSVIWFKTDSNDALLEGSEWQLTGPGTDSVTIQDCVTSGCDGELDIDSESGQFKLENLAWGEYVLKETKAPAGYQLRDEDITFTIGSADPAKLNWDLGRLVNDKRDAPVIPLTGGVGRDFFSILGVIVLALGAGAVGVNKLRRREK